MRQHRQQRVYNTFLSFYNALQLLSLCHHTTYEQIQSCDTLNIWLIPEDNLHEMADSSSAI